MLYCASLAISLQTRRGRPAEGSEGTEEAQAAQKGRGKMVLEMESDHREPRRRDRRALGAKPETKRSKKKILRIQETFSSISHLPQLILKASHLTERQM